MLGGARPDPCPECGAPQIVRLYAGITRFTGRTVCTRCLHGREDEAAQPLAPARSDTHLADTSGPVSTWTIGPDSDA